MNTDNNTDNDIKNVENTENVEKMTRFLSQIFDPNFFSTKKCFFRNFEKISHLMHSSETISLLSEIMHTFGKA